MPYNVKQSNNKNIIASLIGNKIWETQYHLITFSNQSIILHQKAFSEYDSRVTDLQQSTLQKAALPKASPVVLCVHTFIVHQSPQWKLISQTLSTKRGKTTVRHRKGSQNCLLFFRIKDSLPIWKCDTALTIVPDQTQQNLKINNTKGILCVLTTGYNPKLETCHSLKEKRDRIHMCLDPTNEMTNKDFFFFLQVTTKMQELMCITRTF